MKPIPQISKYMTTIPVHVEVTCPLVDAFTMMREEGFRHLPVMERGRLKGILSMTDIQVSGMVQGAELTKMKVADVYHRGADTVTPETGVDVVCSLMAREKHGCTLVTDNGKLVGIFTWIDALRAMDDLLHTRLK